MAATGTTTKHMLTYVNNVSRNKASFICIILLLPLSSSSSDDYSVVLILLWFNPIIKPIPFNANTKIQRQFKSD